MMSRLCGAVVLFFCLLFPAASYAANPISISALPTIAAMQSLGAASAFYPSIQVLGYNAAGDGGGGSFLWVAASTATADGCVTFSASGVSTGRWVRQLNGSPLYVEMCGAYNDATHATATQAALQAASDYMQSSGNPNGEIHFRAGTYDCGTGSSCVDVSAAEFCPNFIGAGNSVTNVKYLPASEAAAFLFRPSIGRCNKGGVRGLRVLGNTTNTIGCEFLSTTDGYCNITTDDAKEVYLLCSCTSGGFSENISVTLNQSTGSVTRYLEYRTNGGGTGSFRNSGPAPGSLLGPAAATANAAILIGAGSFPYSAPLYLSHNNQTNGTLYLVDNQSANFVSFFGELQIEVGPGTTKISKSNLIGFGGPITKQIPAGSNLQYGTILFGDEFGTVGGQTTVRNGWYQLENDNAVVQYLSAGTAATTVVSEPFSPNSQRIYHLALFSASGASYKWDGVVVVNTDSSGTFVVPTVVQSSLIADVGSLGAPAFSVSGGKLAITITGAVGANSIRIYDVTNVPGELEN